MNPKDLIRKKRDGGKLSSAEINAFVNGVCNTDWADYQTSALLMAMFLRGLDADEQNALTGAMLYSGEILDFSDIEKPKADKHSTGGVGDKTSLIIAPLLAACGVSVPMISGRGLGHTGGTLDKLEAIADYNVNLSTEEFKRIVKQCGFAMTGQTAEIAPADKKIYALRDATATVPFVPFIVASIMSKKLAEGLDALVLDVKAGSGAFMETLADARKLARALVETGKNFGVKTEAVISDMNEPLGKYVGNAPEVFECVKILRGEIDRQMRATLDLSVNLAAHALTLTGIAKDFDEASAICLEKIRSGEALEKFKQNIELQKGNPRICDQPDTLLEKNILRLAVKAEKNGFITEIDAKAVGETVALIGGGRARLTDAIDAAVGFACEKKIGDEARKGDCLGTLFCRAEAQAAQALAKLRESYKIEDEKPLKKIALIKEIIV